MQVVLFWLKEVIWVNVLLIDDTFHLKHLAHCFLFTLFTSHVTFDQTFQLCAVSTRRHWIVELTHLGALEEARLSAVPVSDVWLVILHNLDRLELINRIQLSSISILGFTKSIS